MLHTTNIVGRIDYYKGQRDTYIFALVLLKRMLDDIEPLKTFAQIITIIEDFVNEPFEEYDENSHFYKDAQKDTLPYFNNLFLPLGYLIKKSDIPELCQRIRIKLEYTRSELNKIYSYFYHR